MNTAQLSGVFRTIKLLCNMYFVSWVVDIVQLGLDNEIVYTPTPPTIHFLFSFGHSWRLRLGVKAIQHKPN